MPNIADLIRLAARQAARGLRLGADVLEFVGGSAAQAAETVTEQTQQVAGQTAAQAAQVVDAAAAGAGQAAGVAQGVAGVAADVATDAVGQAAQVAGEVAGQTAQVAGEVAGQTAGVAQEAVGQAAEVAQAAAGGTAQVAQEAAGAGQSAVVQAADAVQSAAEADLDVGDPQATQAPKDLDDVTIARKIESEIFRDRRVPKSKIDVNVADGVAFIRGEAKTPRQINQIEEKAAAIPEVVRVENLLHLPNTPAATRTDTPDSMRKEAGRRTRPRSADVHLHAEPVTGERPPETPEAETAPAELARAGKGRQPAPMGSQGGRDEEPGGSANGDVEPIAELPAAGETSPAGAGSVVEADAAAGAPVGEADEGDAGRTPSGGDGDAFAGDGGSRPTPTTGTTRPRGVQ